MRGWNWDGMVEGNRVRLVRLLAGLVVLLGSGETVKRVVWREVLAALVPMESALRRLIYVMARDLPVVVTPARGCPGNIPKKSSGERKAVFALTDPLRDPTPKSPAPKGPGPRIHTFDNWVPAPPGKPAPSDDDMLDGSALRRRLEAMAAALADLPKQARRLARWYARNERQREGGAWRRTSPLRSGRPPGNRKHGKSDVDVVLATCHDLAVRCLRMMEKERYRR